MFGHSHCGTPETNPNGLAHWVVGIWHFCELWYRLRTQLGLLWLWHRPEAVAQIGPLAWELSYATSVALKKEKKKKKKVLCLFAMQWTLVNFFLSKHLNFLLRNCFSPILVILEGVNS